ncbi:hypothetical protein [Blastococcus brunescens]|uniref:Uncharacterized protein n=1 Tax=Blastococcus brunescens TaxID=1564165 RepID=A0ABZ1B465_9ACTN|nr:hypothetical protein [Blastococcus sp. BMG 8361]WRL64613.1 hypothetical protein U6N30_02085 [Blastococcus sp. BMG 8361]
MAADRAGHPGGRRAPGAPRPGFRAGGPARRRGVAALLGLGVLGALAPARSRFVRRRRAQDGDVSARRSVAAVTVAVIAICLAAAVAVAIPAD